MPNPDRDWSADIRPIDSTIRATRATRATPAGEARESAVSADAALLPKAKGSRATPGNKAAAVAPVAQPLPGEGNTGATPQTVQFPRVRQSVAPVAPIALEIETKAQRQDEYEERAAMIEYGAGVPRAWAEGFARLDLSAPPPGCTPRQWEQVVNNGGLFLDRWAAEAARLGWSAEDVFGVHPAAPGARYDCMGLVPLIGGGTVLSITTDRATIRQASGATLVYLRRPRHGAVALWKLEVCEQ